MYSNPTLSVGAGAAAGGLAYTGSDSIYLGMAAFALVAAGSALKRMAPVLRGPQARRRRSLLDG